MAGKRRYVPASEFCVTVRDGTHDSPKPVEKGRKLVTSRHLTSGRLDLSGAYLISEVDFEAINKRSKVDRWDVLISMIGTVGEPCLLRDDPDFAIKNIGLFKTKSELDGRWLYYYLRSAEAQHRIREQSRGTTQQYIPLGALRNLLIPVAENPEEQKRIAHILGTLDDKIDLNHRMNATLEALAQALFKSWFVDFDPVRAKASGEAEESICQRLGMSAEVLALFPDRLVESELGEIPEGWEIKPAGDVVECVGGATPSTSEPSYWDGGIHPWTTPKDLSSLQAPFLIGTERKLSEQGLKKISSGLLPRGTLLLSSRAPVGYLAITDIPVAINQGYIAMKCSKQASNYFMLNWCQTNMDEIKGRATGTTFPEISKLNFRPIPMILPPNTLMKMFTEYVSPKYHKIVANLRQSASLEIMRDTLLPQLLSGKLSVTEVDLVS